MILIIQENSLLESMEILEVSRSPVRSLIRIHQKIPFSLSSFPVWVAVS